MSRYLGMLLLALPMLALAGVPQHRIEVVDGAGGPQLRVSGSWPDSCPRELLPVFVDGQTIDISVRSNEAICSQVVTAYAFNVDPRASSGFGRAPDGLYRVRLMTRDGTSRSAVIGFRVADLTPTATRHAQPEAGFWTPDSAGEFRPANGGIGLMVETQGNTVALTTNAYELGGDPVWYLAAGSLDRSSMHADLLLSTGGQPVWGTSRIAQFVQPVGTLSVEFHSSGRATAWYARTTGEGLLDPLDLTPISLLRMNFALPPDGGALSGTWVLVGTDATSRSTPLALRLQFSAGRSDRDTAVLEDVDAGAELRCVVEAERREAAPQSCQLLRAGAPIAQFDNNAFTRLAGRAGDGSAVVLVRVAD